MSARGTDTSSVILEQPGFPPTIAPLPPGTTANPAVNMKEVVLRGKAFRSMKIAASILEVAEKFGDVATLTDKVPVLGLIAWSFVALCDILRYHFQRLHRLKNKENLEETNENKHDFGHKKAVRFRAIKCFLSCLKLAVHLVATVLQFTLPGTELLLHPISNTLTAFSSSFTLNDDSHKYTNKLKYKFVPGVKNPFARIGVLIKKTMDGSISNAEYREVSAFTGKAVFTAIGLIGAGLAIACAVTGPLAPLVLVASLISAFGVIGYSTCSITKAAFDLQEEKEKAKQQAQQVEQESKQNKSRAHSLFLPATGKRPRDHNNPIVGNRRKCQSTGCRITIRTC